MKYLFTLIVILTILLSELPFRVANGQAAADSAPAPTLAPTGTAIPPPSPTSTDEPCPDCISPTPTPRAAHYSYAPIVFQSLIHNKIFYIAPDAWDYWSPWICGDYSCWQTDVHPTFTHEITADYRLWLIIVYDDYNNAFVFPFALTEEREMCAAWVCASYDADILTIINGAESPRTIIVYVDEVRLPALPVERQDMELEINRLLEVLEER